MSNQRDVEIRIDKIPVKGAIGVLFMVGGVLILAIGVPMLRWILASSIVGGALIGVGLLMWRRRHA